MRQDRFWRVFVFGRCSGSGLASVSVLEPLARGVSRGGSGRGVRLSYLKQGGRIILAGRGFGPYRGGMICEWTGRTMGKRARLIGAYLALLAVILAGRWAWGCR